MGYYSGGCPGPFISWFAKILGGRRTLASVLFVLVILAALVIPTVLLVSSSVDAVQTLSEQMQDKTLSIPPPPAKVADWPLIGDKVHHIWQLSSTNLEAALKQFSPQLKTAAGNLLGSVGGSVIGLFMIIISTCIAGVFLAKVEKSSAVAEKIITRLAGEKGAEITALATATIRGVMQGVVGVAVIQATLAAIGMVVVGVPAAGLWALLMLVVAVIQLPPILVLGPVAAYVFSVSDTTPAVLFLIWILLVCASESVLKPLLMGRGSDIPMLVILIGALGGMMLFGIIGLFVGAVVLAIMYTLFMAWINEIEQACE
ncbi:MAG: AI-2E family transporter [Thermodesulfobacteriota bacterium]|nr:AI-2E family transporter [Thermodesulfobacteriota bacterium]